MSRLTVQVEGFRELDKALGELGKSAGRATLKRALTKAAQPIADRAHALAPIDKGILEGSIVVSSKFVNRAGFAEYGATLRGGGTKTEARTALRGARRGGNSETRAELTVAAPAPHAHLVEFGTVKMDAQPFMRPAWESEKQGALASIAGTLRIEIAKTAARQARKAARLAGKG